MKKHGHFNWKEEQKNWSKIIEPVVSKAGHAICRICDNDGLLKQIIVSKSKTDKYGKLLKYFLFIFFRIIIDMFINV